jgi:omptin
MRSVFLAAIVVAAASSAQAEDLKLQSLDGMVTFSGSFGVTGVRAKEFVYQGKAKLSQLNWKSDYISTLTGTVNVELPKEFYLSATASVGFDGNGHMADFDWLQPGKPWSDRSLHPDTRLDHYFVGGVEVGRMLISRNGTDIGLGAGFKYTDIQWTAWGGSYVYSVNGFRDSRGNFDPDQKGISYRQSWPVPYLGLNLSHHEGAWTFSGAVQGGLAVDADDIDDHWVRNLRFYDYFNTTPTLAVSSSVNYAVWNNAALYLSGSLDNMFRVRGDTKMVNTNNGKERWFYNGAGGSYRSATISFGLRGNF